MTKCFTANSIVLIKTCLRLLSSQLLTLIISNTKDKNKLENQKIEASNNKVKNANEKSKKKKSKEIKEKKTGLETEKVDPLNERVSDKTDNEAKNPSLESLQHNAKVPKHLGPQ